MSLKGWCYLRCDECALELDGLAERVAPVRTLAFWRGWLVDPPGDRDLCPNCRAQSEATAKIVGNLATVADEVGL